MAKQEQDEALQTYNVLGKGTSVKGELQSTGNLRIDGVFEGTLALQGKLVIGTSGQVRGKIQCTSAEIEGSVSVEKMEVSGLLFLKRTAKVDGCIQVQKLGIEQGALFSGQCIMPDERSEIK